jgi:hypothetical protein
MERSPVKAIIKILIVQIAFVQTKRREPNSRINPYLIGKSARAAISTAITFRCNDANQKARRSVELIPEVWHWLSLLLNGIIRHAGTSRVKE